MFLHEHPYPPFTPPDVGKLIVGTIPPPRFSTGELFEDDVDFGYGSRYGLLWPILENIYETPLDYRNTARAIEQRMGLLQKNQIGICDMVERCRRVRMEASDLGMKHIRLRNIIHVLEQNPTVSRILFMGGNTKNGPEALFRKLAREKKIKLTQKRSESPRLHSFCLSGREIEAVSLTSPSSAANRSIGANSIYKERKKADPHYSTLEFRIDQYMEFFLD